MKFHAFCTILVLMVSIFLGVSRMELIV
ncbi:MAG: diacylglycerol kinase, partial [Cetobacterium sp.]